MCKTNKKKTRNNFYTWISTRLQYKERKFDSNPYLCSVDSCMCDELSKPVSTVKNSFLFLFSFWCHFFLFKWQGYSANEWNMYPPIENFVEWIEMNSDFPEWDWIQMVTPNTINNSKTQCLISSPSNEYIFLHIFCII